jgi:hypothetical protein
MSEPNRCTHGMPSPASCVTCMEEGVMVPPPKPKPLVVEAVFRAIFDGDCPECSLAMPKGAMIAKLSNGRYVHWHCSPKAGGGE